MIIKEIEASETIPLRSKVLRQGLSLEHCVFPGDTDDSTHHLGCTVDNNIVGIISIYNRSNVELHAGCGYQIRAMATCDSFQGKGMGLELLKAAEKTAYDLGADYLWANARSSAIGFYKKAGFSITGEAFDIKGVGPHFVIYRQKRLSTKHMSTKYMSTKH